MTDYGSADYRSTYHIITYYKRSIITIFFQSWHLSISPAISFEEKSFVMRIIQVHFNTCIQISFIIGPVCPSCISTLTWHGHSFELTYHRNLIKSKRRCEHNGAKPREQTWLHLQKSHCMIFQFALMRSSQW